MKSIFSRLAGAAALALAFNVGAAAAPDRPDYLLVHFTGESSDGEQIHFAVATDGFHFTDLDRSRWKGASPSWANGPRSATCGPLG